MKKRYTIAITNYPTAGHNMIAILVIDTHAQENSKKEIYNGTAPKSEKVDILHKYMKLYGDDVHVVDASTSDM